MRLLELVEHVGVGVGLDLDQRLLDHHVGQRVGPERVEGVVGRRVDECLDHQIVGLLVERRRCGPGRRRRWPRPRPPRPRPPRAPARPRRARPVWVATLVSSVPISAACTSASWASSASTWSVDLATLRPHLVELALGLGGIRLLRIRRVGQHERGGHADCDQQPEGVVDRGGSGSRGSVLLRCVSWPGYRRPRKAKVPGNVTNTTPDVTRPRQKVMKPLVGGVAEQRTCWPTTRIPTCDARPSGQGQLPSTDQCQGSPGRLYMP